MYLYPVCLLRMSWILGRGYCLLLTTSFSSLKSLTQRTLPSFLGVIKVREAHFLAPCADNTPMFPSELQEQGLVYNASALHLALIA